MAEDQDNSLYNKTLSLLKNRPRTQTYELISGELGISVSWLRTFGKGRIPNPSVNIIQPLYEYLSGTDLKV